MLIQSSSPSLKTLSTVVSPINGKTCEASQAAIDINTLREKSKHLDLPLISALCNDRSLLKQTRAFVLPKHPRSSSNQITITNKGKYPVSGLSTVQLVKPKKTSISHRHPNDKLPPLPCQTTEGNNYVILCTFINFI